MFEKEAEEYGHEHCCDSCKNLQARYRKVFKDGAEFGYNGTCNFDMVMIRKEKTFTYDETIAIFKECGINASRGSEWSRYYSGLIGLPNYKGQAERNTKWAETFGESLKEQGFTVSMYYQCD